MSRIRFLVQGASCAVLLALLASSAPAAMADPAPGVRVYVADLDLARPEGVRTLLSRLRVASEQACGPHPVLLAISETQRYQACRTTAQENAVRQLGNASVTAAFEQRIGRPVMLATIQ